MTKIFTNEERDILRGKYQEGYTFVARDCDERLYFYENTVTGKDEDTWYCDSGEVVEFDCPKESYYFKSIKFSDSDPIYIFKYM